MDRLKEFEENFKTNRKSLINFLYSKVNKTDAEDVLQRASLIMWKKYDTFDSTTNFLSWAFTIVGYEASNYRRSFNRCPVTFDSEAFDVASMKLIEYKDDNEVYEKFQIILNDLDEESKNLLIQVYVNGEEIRDVAKKAKKSPQTYYNKLNILKKFLAEKLK